MRKIIGWESHQHFVEATDHLQPDKDWKCPHCGEYNTEEEDYYGIYCSHCNMYEDKELGEREESSEL